ncbi:MAG: hypothetical protein JWP35_368 [Caulobacter sp.]|nr:hypothetical protein [Caulobacter sp.]
MRRLIYASHWAEGVRNDAHHTLQAIIGKSIQNNRLDDITGFLISHNGVFLQALEGPDRAIATIFAKIAADPRHADIKVLSDEAAEGRLFRSWAMAGAACWHPAVAEDFDYAAGLGFEGFPAEALLDLLRAVATTDIGRVPCTVAA